MDYRRFNIAQLSKETNTCRTTLHEWIRNGWLEHVQIVGSRKKYSIDAFLKAEKLALEEASKSLKQTFRIHWIPLTTDTTRIAKEISMPFRKAGLTILTI
ncbi:hypothetical protein MASR1M45_12230 [Candidatus Kapaibacterium sp.]